MHSVEYHRKYQLSSLLAGAKLTVMPVFKPFAYLAASFFMVRWR